MRDAFLLAGARTPIGKFLGGLSSLTAAELGGLVIGESVRRAGVEPSRIDEVIMGSVLTAGQGQAPARQATLKAGLPERTPALTINKVCGSGLKAVMLAAQAVRCGDAETVVAGGMESMSRAPHLLRGMREGVKFGDITAEDSMLVDGLCCAFDACHMGLHAEYTAEKAGVTRAMQDQFAVTSQQRAAAAIAAGHFSSEIVPVTVRVRKEERHVSQDEAPRPETTLATLEKLRPAFLSEGTVTAGNASLLSDGAAAVVVGSEQVLQNSAAPWKARIVASHTSGMAPRDLFFAPVLAVQGVLRKAGLTVQDVDLFEINEAFASQMLACIQELQLDPARVNVSGGAIALGHPIGASGARVLVTLLAALHRLDLRRGVAALCLGGGNAVSMLIERI